MPGPGGRGATLLDPAGCEIRLWQARRRKGAQLVNAPGAWNFSNLRAADPGAAQRFYGELFGWRFTDQGWATAISVPGYGDHLEATVDPGIRTRQAAAPEGFADVIGSHRARRRQAPGWSVVLTVADRDAAATRAESLGGTVLGTTRDRLDARGRRSATPRARCSRPASSPRPTTGGEQTGIHDVPQVGGRRRRTRREVTEHGLAGVVGCATRAVPSARGRP